MVPVSALTTSAPSLDFVDLSSAVGSPVSLEERMAQAYATAAQDAGQRHAALTAASLDPAVAANPARLAQLQSDLSNYVLEMNLTSTLARKAVGCIETLVKAQ